MANNTETLNPTEIKNREFSRTPFGYSPTQVVQFLDQVAKAWEHVQDKEKEHHLTIQHLKKKIEDWESREPNLKRLEQEAKIKAEQIEENAQQKAQEHWNQVQKQTEKLREQAEGWLENVIEKVEQTEMRRLSSIEEFKKSLDRHYSILEEEKNVNPELHKLMQDSKKGLKPVDLV